ncbi:MAG: DNA polymerase III subunit delta [Pseudomonadota bacterium]
MKVPAARVEAFAKAPDPAVQAVLVYGADEGMVRERGLALVKSAVEDPGDPFRVALLAGPELKKDPARLADEAAALSLTGGRRVVRVQEAGDDLAELVGAFLKAPQGDALLVFEAGDLPARSKMRKLFEGTDKAAALACYRDEGAALAGVIRAALAEAGLEASPDALAYLAANLGGDRQLTRRELEKLALYMGPDAKRIELEDAETCVGDSSLLAFDDLANAVAEGDLDGLERRLARSFQEGGNPVALLRAIARHFQRLHLVAGHRDQGLALGEATKRLRPPLFWKQREPFERQCRTWSASRLAAALESLLAAEAACKQTGQPAELIAARCLWSLAANARRGQS